MLMLMASACLQGPHHMPETRGLCLSEEQTVSSVSSVSQGYQAMTAARMVTMRWSYFELTDIPASEIQMPHID